jgi:phosphoglycerate kinase
MEKEISALDGILESPERPFMAIVGGAKIADKIGVLGNLVGKVDGFLFGGGMANTFLRADGIPLGDSLVDEGQLDFAGRFLDNLRRRGIIVELPIDLVIARNQDSKAIEVLPPRAVPAGWMALDIGTRTAERYARIVGNSQTVFWNGPLGMFEQERFARGSEAVARALTRPGIISVVGGGDSLAVLDKIGLTDKVTHASTGGGASLEFLEGKILPGISILTK